MEIRPAEASEAQALSALAMEAKSHWGYSREALEGWRDELTIAPADIAAKAIHVAVIDGKLVGFCSLTRHGKTRELGDVWVAPRFMRRGIGRALVMHALDLAWRGGASAVSVDADPNAEAFYLACGAVRRGAVPAPISGQPGRVRPQLEFNGKLD